MWHRVVSCRSCHDTFHMQLHRSAWAPAKQFRAFVAAWSRGSGTFDLCHIVWPLHPPYFIVFFLVIPFGGLWLVVGIGEPPCSRRNPTPDDWHWLTVRISKFDQWGHTNIWDLGPPISQVEACCRAPYWAVTALRLRWGCREESAARIGCQ